MDDDCWFGTTASTAPDLDTSQGTTLNGCASGDDGGVASVSCLEITEELQMVGVWVVCSKP
jgi:hypothetical protein